MRFCDELPYAIGWIAPEPAFMQRASHALATSAGVYLIDPVDGPQVDERVRALGTPVGVIQLLDRHTRDSEALAERYDVPLHRVPTKSIPGSPFQILTVLRTPVWKEAALWWPEHRTLIVAEALGSAPYYRAPHVPLAVHPFLRLLPPRTFTGLSPEHVLVGHGEGIHGADAKAALSQALVGSRRGAPGWLVSQGRARLKRS